MKRFMLGGVAAITIVMTATTVMAQPPGEQGGTREGRRGPGGPGGGFGPPPNPILKALDADQNHELSEQEIDNAVAALKKLDKNDDGILSREELRPRRRRGGPRGGPGGEFRGAGRRGPESDRPPRRDDDRARRRPGQSPERSAGRRGPGRPDGPRGPGVDRIMSQDTDGDGKVSEEEMLARVRKMFGRADQNQDGFISRNEAEQMVPQFARRYGREGRRENRGRDRPPRSERPESE